MSRRKRLAFPAASISLSGLRPKGAGRLRADGIGDIAGADHAGKRHARALVEEVLDAMTGKFEALYFACGPPLDPARAIEQIDYNMLFRWFVGLSMDDGVWDASTFSKNRERLMRADVAREFLAALLSLPRVKRLLSSDHFSVDGTLIDAWASMESFVPKDGSGKPAGGGLTCMEITTKFISGAFIY
jgi:hypothetical protein